MTQREPVSPTIFNILVDAVARAVLLEFCGPQEELNGLRWATGKHNICFYGDDRRIAGHNPIWMQTALTAIVRMFGRAGLQKYLSKTKSMLFLLGLIWGQQGVEAYNRRATGEGPTFQERKRTRVSCKECGGKWTRTTISTIWRGHMV